MRYVAFWRWRGAHGAAGGNIHVFTGDAAEAMQQIKAGAKVRLLAVMHDKRLAGDMAAIPTASEGFDVQWHHTRFYLGPR